MILERVTGPRLTAVVNTEGKLNEAVYVHGAVGRDEPTTQALIDQAALKRSKEPLLRLEPCQQCCIGIRSRISDISFFPRKLRKCSCRRKFSAEPAEDHLRVSLSRRLLDPDRVQYQRDHIVHVSVDLIRRSHDGLTIWPVK